jgi:hypothetical protein
MKERVPPRQMGIIAMSKGPYLEPTSASIETETKVAGKRQPKETVKNRKQEDGGETFEDGTWATCRHVSCIAANEGLIWYRCEKKRVGDERAHPAK